jgi:lambda family phage tail tape measure protein
MAADQAAGLTLKVDASSIPVANKAMDELVQKSGQAETATNKFNEANRKTKSTASEAAEGLEKEGRAAGVVATNMTKTEKIAQQLGTTQKNVAFATRNAALQLQDVVVSLDMGMPVYRVLLQQLPQVTGAFGGLGNTLRALVGFLGPVGLALTAVTAALTAGVVVVGRTESQMAALNKTLTLTGNISGLTADQMLRMAENADSAGKSFRGTLNSLQALANAGVKAGADFERLARTVQDFAKASGQPLEDVADQVGKLSNDPVGGLQALADKYHVVTQAQVEHVRQLQNQGKEAEAVAQANSIAAKSFDDMSAEIKGNMGSVERAMMAVTSAAKTMWNAILDIGRAESTTEQEMDIRKRLQDRITAYNAETKAIREQNGVATQAQQSRINNLNQEIDELNRSLGVLTKASAAKRQEARDTEAQAKAQEEANRKAKERNELETQYSTNAEKRAKEQTRLNNLLKQGVITQTEYDKYLAEANKRYADPKVAKAAAVKVDAGLKMLESAQAELAALKAAGAQQAANALDGTRAAKAQAELNKLNAEYATLEEAAKTRTLTVAERQQMAEMERTKLVREQILQEAKRQDAVEKTLKAHQQVDLYLKNQNAEIKGITEGYALSTREASNLREQLELIDRLQRAGASQQDQDRAVAKLKETQAAMRGDNATLFEGFSRGLADMVDETGNAYTQMEGLTKFTFSAMTDSLDEFFTTGKFGIKDLVNTMLAELVRLATSSALKSLASIFGKGSGGSLFGDIFASLTANAKGGAYSGGNLSAFSGQIVTQPTFFNYGVKAFANGAGLMGEAGPEAIMPLTRGPDGKLGVQASGAAGGIFVETNVNMGTGQTSTSVSGTGNAQAAAAFGKQITEAVKAEIAKQTRPGGILYKR